MANATYRGVEELTAAEFEELREALYYSKKDEQGDKCPYESVEDVPDKDVLENYSGISFVEEDFWCNVK